MYREVNLDDIFSKYTARGKFKEGVEKRTNCIQVL